jgi:peptidyl-prolyl cis-trans isomerase A (cyclophilin A)/peptidyl-prolyl cis-trans isomerase B (cyclophilin B)
MHRLLAFLALLSLSFSAQAAPQHPLVELKTNRGSITLELFPEKAPKTVENFLRYVNEGYYRHTTFHRAVKNFIIQGGAYTADMQWKPAGAPIPSEADNGLGNETGTIAMARSADPHSATTQFFINLDDNKMLNYWKPEPQFYGFAVFGRVIRGLDVARNISQLPTGPKGGFAADVPEESVVIEDATLVGQVASTGYGTAQLAEKPRPAAKPAKAAKKSKTSVAQNM